jgi:hypothetical protein
MTDPWGTPADTVTYKTTNLCLLLFGVYNINNFLTILINSILFHNNSFYVSNLCAKLYRKPLRNHRKQSNIVLFFQEDKISHKMLKISPEKIAIPLQIIFNKSLRQCKYPSSWKNAHVIAIFKKGDTSLPSNYRPISLISCVG